jgi:fibronectin-binding autotransporter adhesin
MMARGGLVRRFALILVAGFAAHSGPHHAALAQSTWLPTSGTVPWTTGTAWSGGTIPDGIDAVAVFPAAGPTVLLDDTTVTVGTITQSSTSGNLVIGSTGTAGSSTDVINLAVSSGVPVISVGGGNMYMYAQLTGTQGLRKNGGGVYSPRYNTLDFTYTGTNYFGGGTVQIARDGQLGDAANPIEVLASTALQNWGIAWTSTRPITISTGTLTLQHGAAANTASLSGPITGTGGLAMVTGNYALAGPVSYGGSTLIRSATVSLTGGGLLSTASLSLQTAAASTGGSLVDFGGGSQGVSTLALSLAAGGTVHAVNTFRNGSLAVAGGNLNVGSGASTVPTGTTQLDLRGLSGFSWGNGTGTLVLNTTGTVAGSTVATVMSLPTSGSASLTAAHVQVGNSSNGPASSTASLQLGAVNSIATGTLTVGAYRGNGAVAFAPDVIGGSLLLRGAAGGESRVDSVYVGFKGGGDVFGNGVLDVSAGSIDAKVANFNVGFYFVNASSGQTGTFAMTSGAVDATTLTLGNVSVASGSTGTPTITSVFSQAGGLVTASSMVFGANAATLGTNNPTFRGTYALAGGTLALGSAASGTGPSSAASQRRLAWTGGVLTTRDAATDLVVAGKSGSGGAILFDLGGVDAKTLDVPAGRIATFGPSVAMSGTDTAFTKTGGGTLVLGGEGFTTSYGGTTSVAAGTLLLNGDHSTATGPLQVASAATLGGSGTFGGAATVDTGATFSPGASPGTLAFTQDLTWNPGVNYAWQMLSGTGLAGAADSWDLIQVGGALSIAATSIDPFKINLWTLSGIGPDVSGAAANFDPSQNYSWTIASAAGGITGFAADKFLISTSATNGTGGFANSVGSGTFSVAQSGNDLNLVFTSGGGPTVITINVASGTQTQTQAGSPALSGSTPVVKTGAGTLVVDQTNTLSGSTTVQGGVLQLANASALASSRLVVVAGGTGQLAPQTVTSVAGLDLATGNGLMDVTSGALTISSGMTAPQLVAELLEGRGDGSWTGTSGITSSTAAAESAVSIPRAVGWLDNGDGSFTVAYAAPGDTNLDWSIDILDASNFLAFGKFDTGSPATWIEGDFSYDGIVDILDAADFFSTGLYDAGNYNSASGAAGVAAVPEPSGFAVVAVAAAGAWLVGRAGRRTVPSPARASRG